MGTSWSVKIVSDQPVDQQNTQSAIQSILDDVNAKMSNWEPSSDISRFNASGSGCIEISPETAEVVEISLEMSLLTAGVFDVTLGPLIELWGFGREFTADQMPEAQAIESRLEQIGYDKLRLDGTGLCKDLDGLFVNLSATAKGYGVDQVADYLVNIGVEHYLVEVGGELRGSGLNGDSQQWRVGIETPLDNLVSGQVQAVVELDNQALATSGDYRNYFMHQGVRYSHILNPVTGYPVVQDLASVTVLHNSAAWADAWATALLALGPEQGLALAEQKNVASYFILRSETGFEIRTSTDW